MASSKKSKTYPNYNVIDRKPEIQNLKSFSISNYKASQIRRGFEQLSSSICCWVMADQILPWEYKSYLFCNFCIFAKIWVFEPWFWIQNP